MREFIAPSRQKSFTSQQQPLPTPKDGESLSAIMAKRRSIADSDAEPTHWFGSASKSKHQQPPPSYATMTTTSSSNTRIGSPGSNELFTKEHPTDGGDDESGSGIHHMRSDLYNAMRKRRTAVESGAIPESPRQNKSANILKHVKMDCGLQDKLKRRLNLEENNNNNNTNSNYNNSSNNNISSHNNHLSTAMPSSNNNSASVLTASSADDHDFGNSWTVYSETSEWNSNNTTNKNSVRQFISNKNNYKKEDADDDETRTLKSSESLEESIQHHHPQSTEAAVANEHTSPNPAATTNRPPSVRRQYSRGEDSFFQQASYSTLGSLGFDLTDNEHEGECEMDTKSKEEADAHNTNNSVDTDQPPDDDDDDDDDDDAPSNRAGYLSRIHTSSKSIVESDDDDLTRITEHDEEEEEEEEEDMEGEENEREVEENEEEVEESDEDEYTDTHNNETVSEEKTVFSEEHTVSEEYTVYSEQTSQDEEIAHSQKTAVVEDESIVTEQYEHEAETIDEDFYEDYTVYEDQPEYGEQTVYGDDYTEHEQNTAAGGSNGSGGIQSNRSQEADEDIYESYDEESDPLYEIDTVAGTSVNSKSTHGDWNMDKSRDQGALGEPNCDASYSDHDEEISRAPSIATARQGYLDAVQEEDTANGESESRGFDDNVFGGKIVEGRVDRDIPMGHGNSAMNETFGLSSEGTSANDHREQALSKEIKKKSMSSRFSWPLVFCLVLLFSTAIGVGGGFLFWRGSEDKDVDGNRSTSGNIFAQAPSATSSPAVSPINTSETYSLLCSKLITCDSLLDMLKPQGMAYDWLINDKDAHPDTQLLSDDDKIRRYALATFYFSTAGETWANNTNWLSNENECKWFSTSESGSACGVYNKQFTALALDNNNLQGELPYELALLTSLMTISLRNPVESSPDIRGNFPSQLSALTSLTSITISGNQFGSNIPSELGKLTNLERLDVSYNGVNGEIPSSFSSLSKLTSLNVEGNFLNGEINPAVFDGTKALKEVNLASNRFVGLPSSIIGLTQLRTLKLGFNVFSTFPLSVTQLADLFVLDVRSNGFTGEVPVQLGRMSSLRHLDLSGNAFTGTIPLELGSLVQLNETLDLSNNDLSGSIPSRLGLLTSLTRLRLNGNQLTGFLPTELASLVLMKELRIEGNDVSGMVPTTLCTLLDSVEGPASFADCDELASSACFTNCCTNGSDCRCRFETTDPFRCVF